MTEHPLPPARHQPHLLILSTQTTSQKKTKYPEMKFNSQQIVSYCLCLIYTEPRAKEGRLGTQS